MILKIVFKDAKKSANVFNKVFFFIIGDAYRVYLPPSGKYSSNYINAVFVNVSSE